MEGSCHRTPLFVSINQKLSRVGTPQLVPRFPQREHTHHESPHTLSVQPTERREILTGLLHASTPENGELVSRAWVIRVLKTGKSKRELIISHRGLVSPSISQQLLSLQKQLPWRRRENGQVSSRQSLENPGYNLPPRLHFVPVDGI